jgi:hypothetical protein
MGQKMASVTAPSSTTTTANAIDADNDINPSLIQSASGTAGLLKDAGDLTEPVSGLSKALGFLPLGLSGVSTLLSMSEAGKAADAQRAAKRASDKALTEMKRLQEQNFYEALKAPTEAYDRQFREATAAGSEAINALAQDQRMLIGGAQGVQEATIEGQAKTREALADRLYNLDVMKAQANAQQADDLSKIAAEEAKGAQIAAMAAQKAKTAQQQAMLQGAGGVLTQGVAQIGTYGGLAGMEDKLQGLLSGTSFAKPAATAQTDYAKMLQGLMADPNILQYLQSKKTL